MKKLVFAVFAALSFVATAQDHNYVSRDGMEYLYPSALTPEQRQAGQVGEQILAYSYLGSRDGKHQVMMNEGSVYAVLECNIPCVYVKAMTFVENDPSGQILVQRFSAAPGSVVSAVMEDVAGGHLEVRTTERKGKKHSLWLDEKKGILYQLVKSK